MPEQAQRAIENFFRKGNLIALRELALRTTADRVDAAMREYREGHGDRRHLGGGRAPAGRVGPDEHAERLVRAGKRMAAALHAEWIVVYVETPELLRLPEAERDRRIALLRLAESLGAEAVTLGGSSVGEELANYARTRNVTRILIGRPRRSLWRRLFRPSTYGELLAQTEGIDLHGGRRRRRGGGAAQPVPRAQPRLPAGRRQARRRQRQGALAGLRLGVAAVAACTLLGLAMTPAFELANVAMVYLLAVVLIASRYGRGPAVAASVLGVAAFDFFFVPPQLSFAVSDIQYLLTFAIMLAVALIISSLTASVRLQARVAGHRERRTALLYAMSRELAATRGEQNMARVAVRHVSEVFDSQVGGAAARRRRAHPPPARRKHRRLAARRRPRRRAMGAGPRRAGRARHRHAARHRGAVPAARGRAGGARRARRCCRPIRAACCCPSSSTCWRPSPRRSRSRWSARSSASSAQRASIDAETEGLRNALLASISHDLRTPLAVISGASSSLAERGERLRRGGARRAGAAASSSSRSRWRELIANVLEMTRLEAGSIALNRDWHALGEIAGSVLHRLRDALAAHPVAVALPADLPLVRVDATLIEQVLANLLENAAKYTPPGTADHAARRARATANCASRSRTPGPACRRATRSGCSPSSSAAPPRARSAASGLGLAICRAIVQLHGGQIWAERRLPAGAAFRFTLPLEEAPAMPAEPV